MKKKLLSALVAVACAPAAFSGYAQAATTTSTPGAKPNIVYIIVDDQRYDAFSFMSKHAVTPNMDKIAANGVHFKNAFVTRITSYNVCYTKLLRGGRQVLALPALSVEILMLTGHWSSSS